MKITSIPSNEQKSKDFKVTLNGVNAELYQVRVSAMPFNCVWPGHQRPLDQTETASVLSFTMDKPVEVELTPEKDFEEVIIRPLFDKVAPMVMGRTIRFTIEKAGQYSVELDGHHNPLFIFANPNKEWGISKDDKDVIYFGAGVHDAGLIELTDGQTLYIDQDAVVYGYVRAILAKNIRILGYGILDGSKEVRTTQTLIVPIDISRRSPETDRYSPILCGQPVGTPEYPIRGTKLIKDKSSFEEYLQKWNIGNTCVQLYECQNVEINGIVLRNSLSYVVMAANTENLICDNIKLVGQWRYNTDGIDLLNCRNTTIRNSFLRDFDDCVVLKGIPGWDTWSMENILVENCVVWCDWGRALELGAETAAPEYKNITFRNCDIIHVSAVAMDIQNCDYAYIHDILFEDIRVEFSKYDESEQMQWDDDSKYIPKRGIGRLICLCYGDDTYYFTNDKRKGNTDGIKFKNIQVYYDVEDEIPTIDLFGYGAEHRIKNVEMQNFTLNGKELPYEQSVRLNEWADMPTIKEGQ